MQMFKLSLVNELAHSKSIFQQLMPTVGFHGPQQQQQQQVGSYVGDQS
jgi:hypothetical protein